MYAPKSWAEKIINLSGVKDQRDLDERLKSKYGFEIGFMSSPIRKNEVVRVDIQSFYYKELDTTFNFWIEWKDLKMKEDEIFYMDECNWKKEQTGGWIECKVIGHPFLESYGFNQYKFAGKIIKKGVR